MKFLKQLFCKHNYNIFIRNIYGDEVNLLNSRSICKCSKCGKYHYSKILKGYNENTKL